MATINLNVAPYFDDYDEAKDYLRVLFRPGFAVQARELTQLQTLLQKQITRFGNHIFKDGSQVTDGNIALNFDAYAVNLVSGTGNVNFPLSDSITGSVEATLENFSEMIVTNAAGDVRAKVFRTPAGITETAKTGRIYISYISKKKFSDSDEGFIYARQEDNPALTQTYVNVFTSVSDATVAIVQDGIYYVDGFFTRLQEQNVVISNTTHKPTATIGFSVQSRAITANDDATLFDNARGATNEGAPGANRLQNSLSIVIKNNLDQGSDPQFYKQIEVDNGVIKGSATNPNGSANPVYASLNDQLALRTKEESGSYVVNPFIPKIVDNLEDSETFDLVLSNGIGYVNGYRVSSLTDVHVPISRQLKTQRVNNFKVPITGVPYIEVKSANHRALPGFDGAGGNGPDAYLNRLALQDSETNTIGYARAYAFKDKGSNNGDLYLHDIRMFMHVNLRNEPADSDLAASLVEGQEVRAGNAKGYVVKLNGTNKADSDWTAAQSPEGGTVAGLARSKGFLVVNASKTFDPQSKLVGELGGITSNDSEVTVTGAYQFKFSQVNRIVGLAAGDSDAAFECVVDSPDGPTTLKNVGSALFGTTPEELSSARGENVQPYDNNFEVLYKNAPTIESGAGGLSVTPQPTDTQWSSNGGALARNGLFDRAIVDDATEITKNLKFAVLKIRNTSDITRSNVTNTSWSAVDRIINLYYPDVYKVYAIHQGSTNNTWGASITVPNASFSKINVTVSGGGAIPVGTVLTGKSSGTKAIIALQNTPDENEVTSLVSQTGYHNTKSGTGDSGKLEVVYLTGTAFTANETLTVKVPAGNDAFTQNVTFTSVDTKVSGSDVTSNYLFDNGQRLNSYNVGSIIRKPDVASPANGDLVVFFSYFEADANSSFFFNVDSYKGAGFFEVDPRYFDTPQPIKKYNPLTGLNLRNTVDFRLRQKLVTSTIKNPLSFTFREFENTGVRVLPDTTFSSDFDIFRGQSINIILTENNEFKAIAGNASVTSNEPEIPRDSMLISTLTVPPAVRYAQEEVSIESKDNSRFTMQDILKIKSRMDRVEDVLSLTLLESQALHDNSDGRTKSGFIVDDFSLENSRSDFGHESYRASIDSQEKTLYPLSVESFFNVQQIDNGTNIDEFYLNQTPGYIVKSYDQEEVLSQTFASETIRINPYNTWIYAGDMNLDPPQDYWKDDSRRVVSGYVIDRTSFGGGIASVSESVFNNLRSTSTQVVGSEKQSTSYKWAGTTTTTKKRYVNTGTANIKAKFGVTKIVNPNETWRSRVDITTKVRAGTKITTTKASFADEKTIKTSFRTKEVRAIDDAFMRSITVKFDVQGLRPNVPLKVLFDGTDVTRYVQQTPFDPTATTREYGALGSLTSDNIGELRGRFTIPANTFKTGVKRFIITDLDGANTTFAAGTFTSRGYFDVGEMVSVRAQTIRDNVTIASNSVDVSKVESATAKFVDPIAQAFTLPLDAGANPNNFDPNVDAPRSTGSFITSVDVWLGFVDTRELQNQVQCQIRNMINGYPGPEVLANSRVTVTKSNENLLQPTEATNFRFDAPCYIEGYKEYCIVVLSPSDKTTAWTAVQGQNDVLTGGKIDQQPNVGGYYGSFFKSQNNSTWTADQNRDLKFKVYRANFGTEDATITFKDTNNFYANPIGQTYDGLALETFDNSHFVKVYHENHGMYGPNDTHQVRILGVEGNNIFPSANDSEDSRFNSASNFNGIPTTLINNVDSLADLTTSAAGKTHNVKYATKDSYFIDLTEADSELSYVSWRKSVKGGKGGGTGVVATSNIQFDRIKTNISPVLLDGTNVTSEIKSTSGSIVDVRPASSKYGYNTNSIYYQAPNIRTDFAEADIDEYVDFNFPQIVQNTLNKTNTSDFENKLTLATENEYLSPIIRVDAMSTMFTEKYVAGDFITDSELELNLTTTSVSIGDSENRHNEFISYIAGVQSNKEFPAYITNEVELAVPANQIKVLFDADMEPGSELIVQYKARPVGDNTPFEEFDWKTFPRNQIVNETNFDSFASTKDYVEYSLIEEVAEEFEALKIKIIFRVQNESFVPSVKDLRIIAVI
jgi:hypothetical protein